jgi:hypothetical protein
MEMVRGGELSVDQANEMIMAARAHWFEAEDAAGASADGQA